MAKTNKVQSVNEQGVYVSMLENLVKKLEQKNLDLLYKIENLKSISVKPVPVVKSKGVRTCTKTYSRTDKELCTGMSLPKQCRIVLDSLTSEPISLETWTSNSVSNGLVTNQDPKHIVMYYRPKLIEFGLIAEYK